jgi:hypothetical protein
MEREAWETRSSGKWNWNGIKLAGLQHGTGRMLTLYSYQVKIVFPLLPGLINASKGLFGVTGRKIDIIKIDFNTRYLPD